MTTRLARNTAVSVLVVLAGCGTTIEQSTSGSSVGTGGAGGASSSSGVTSSSVTSSSSSSSVTSSNSSSSGACDAPPPEACPSTAQCVTSTLDCWCNGSSGSWLCSTANPPSSLPGTAPVEGACCEEEGMSCGGFDPCGPICHCKGGVWSCEIVGACPPFACPSPVQDLNGEACPALVGQVCEGTGTCHYTCICKLDAATGSAAWECTIPPC